MTLSALSEVVRPAYFTAPDCHTTLGPEVGELAVLAGFAPDPEQQLLLDAMFGLDEHGRQAAFEVAVVACRQNLKTGLFKQAALGKIFILERELFVWSAHEFSTAQEAFRDLSVLIESTPALDARVKRIYRGNGDQSIELRGGRRIKFKARTKSGGRGLAGDDVLLDEAFALMPEHMGALLPVLSTRRDPQVMYGSSAGLAHSAVLRGVRDRGRRGSPRLVYAEWSDEEPCADAACSHDPGTPGCRGDDRDVWAAVNTATQRGRITLDYIAAERAAMPPAEFMRERIGHWDEPDAADRPPAVDFETWASRAKPGALPPRRAVVALGVSPDRRWTSLGVAGAGAAGRTLVMVKRLEGTAGAVLALQKLRGKRDVAEVVLHPGGQAGVLIPDLVKAGVEFTPLTTRELGQATARLIQAVKDDLVEHLGQAELDDAMRNATTRHLGEAEVWDRRDPKGDISSVVAVSEALLRWEMQPADEPFNIW